MLLNLFNSWLSKPIVAESLKSYTVVIELCMCLKVCVKWSKQCLLVLQRMLNGCERIDIGLHVMFEELVITFSINVHCLCVRGEREGKGGRERERRECVCV